MPDELEIDTGAIALTTALLAALGSIPALLAREHGE
jgi:hypothetical protein